MAAIGGFPTYKNDRIIYAWSGEAWDPQLTVEYHSHDGFTVWGWTHDDRYVHRRYIGYTVAEGRRLFRSELREGNL